MDIQIGKITHFYDHIGVGVVVVSNELKVGDTIRVLGDETEFTQVVTSMEIEHEKVQSVGKGTEVAIKLMGPARKGDFIYKVVE